MEKSERYLNQCQNLVIIASVLTLAGMGGWKYLDSIRAPIFHNAIAARDKSKADEAEEKEREGNRFTLDDVLLFGSTYKSEFLEYSKRYGVSPELMLAFFHPELNAQSLYTQLRDEFGTAIGLNVSIGLHQMKIKTAMEMNERFGLGRTRAETIRILNTPEGAIEYVAMYLRWTMEQNEIRMGSITEPKNAVYAYAHYVGGEKPTELALLNGFSILTAMKSEKLLSLFGNYDQKTAYDLARRYGNFENLTKDYVVSRIEEVTENEVDGRENTPHYQQQDLLTYIFKCSMRASTTILLPAERERMQKSSEQEYQDLLKKLREKSRMKREEQKKPQLKRKMLGKLEPPKQKPFHQKRMAH